MDGVLIAALTACAVLLGAFLWYLLVQPEVLMRKDAADDLVQDGWFGHNPVLLRFLRVVTGTVLFLLGFLTGLAIAFLGLTAR